MIRPALKSPGNLGKLIPLFIIGMGLIVLGFILPSLLLGENSTSEYSVIPSRVNFPAPVITLNDLNGQKISLTDYQTQIVLINNWATWCPPCKLEMPTFQKYYQAHAQQGFVLLGIEAGDTVEEVASFVEENKLTFPVLLDPNERSLSAFNNDSLPSSYVINRDGEVVLAWTGPISMTMLEKYLTPLLEE